MTDTSSAKMVRSARENAAYLRNVSEPNPDADELDALCDRIEDLEAENARLQEALEDGLAWDRAETAHEEIPQDRGGKWGPKGRAKVAALTARFEFLEKAHAALGDAQEREG